MNARLLHLSLLTAGVLLACASQANASTYTFTDLGGTDSRGEAINNLGQVVGTSYRSTFLWDRGAVTNVPSIQASSDIDISNSGQVAGKISVQFSNSSWGWRASVWNGSTLTVLDALPGTTHNDAWAINSTGQVAGRSVIDLYQGHYHATMWNGTTPTDLGIDSGAYAINDAGLVVGSSSTSGSWGGAGTYATAWNGSTATDLGKLAGAISSEAHDVNNAGQIVGWSVLSDGNHATLWNGSAVTDLGVNNRVVAINNIGQMVGTYNGYAALWNGTVATDVNSFLDASTVSAGWVVSELNDINDQGWIVGTAKNMLTGQNHAFLFSVTAVPEPETYAMLLAGLGLMGGIARRRKSLRGR